jgi:uncharacterized protein YcfJ
MKKAILSGILALCMATPAMAGDWHRDRDRHYGHHDRYDRYDRHDRYDRYDRRHSRDYYRHCKRDSGTGGAIAGAVGGGIFGNAVSGRNDKAVGTILGAAGGALIGRELDRGDVKCR